MTFWEICVILLYLRLCILFSTRGAKYETFKAYRISGCVDARNIGLVTQKYLTTEVSLEKAL